MSYEGNRYNIYNHNERMRSHVSLIVVTPETNHNTNVCYIIYVRSNMLLNHLLRTCFVHPLIHVHVHTLRVIAHVLLADLEYMCVYVCAYVFVCTYTFI